MATIKLEQLPFVIIRPNVKAAQKPIIAPDPSIPEEVRQSMEHTIRERDPNSPTNLRIRAEHGDAMALYRLGYMQYWGLYVDQDRKNGFLLIERAAAKGHVEAYFAMGCFYLKGENVPQDLLKAVDFFRLAAKENYPPALYNIGIYLSMIPGETQNIPEAIACFATAARKGFSAAKERLAEFPKEYVEKCSPGFLH
jgi:TPR repeat protein